MKFLWLLCPTEIESEAKNLFEQCRSNCKTLKINEKVCESIVRFFATLEKSQLILH